MKRRCIVEKYKNLDGEDREESYDYHDYCQCYDIIGGTMTLKYITLLLYSV